jgi:translation initiation factor 1 (eIF-1/SUI1)
MTEIIGQSDSMKNPQELPQWNKNIGETELYIVRYVYSTSKFATIIFTVNFYMLGKPISDILNELRNECISNGCIYMSKLPVKSGFSGSRQYIQLQGDQREKSTRYFILKLGIAPEDIKYDF